MTKQIRWAIWVTEISGRRIVISIPFHTKGGSVRMLRITGLKILNKVESPWTFPSEQ